MSQVTEQSVRFQTALASIKLIQAYAVLDLTEYDFDFLTSNKVWIATDRSLARLFFFFYDTATTEFYTLSLHAALPILRHTSCRPFSADHPESRLAPSDAAVEAA